MLRERLTTLTGWQPDDEKTGLLAHLCQQRRRLVEGQVKLRQQLIARHAPAPETNPRRSSGKASCLFNSASRPAGGISAVAKPSPGLVSKKSFMNPLSLIDATGNDHR